MQTGNDFPFVISMIERQLKMLYLAKKMANDTQALTTELKIHPFVLQKARQYGRNFDLEQLKQLFAKLAGLDFAIKQGKIEPRLGLNLFILAL